MSYRLSVFEKIQSQKEAATKKTLSLAHPVSVIKCLTYLIVLDKLELRLGRKSDGYASIMGIREPGDPLLDVEAGVAGRGRLAQVRLEVLGHFPHTQEVHEV